MIFIVEPGVIQGRIGKLDFYFNALTECRNGKTYHGCTQIWFIHLYISII